MKTAVYTFGVYTVLTVLYPSSDERLTEVGIQQAQSILSAAFSGHLPMSGCDVTLCVYEASGKNSFINLQNKNVFSYDLEKY